MVNQNKSKQSFYHYLQTRYVGKLVAYSKGTKVVYASGKNASELIRKLERKKINLGDIVFSGPIQKPGRTYVYFFSLRIKKDRRRNNF